jgi:hypothetical protein
MPLSGGLTLAGIAGYSVVPETTKCFRQLGLIGRHHPALAGGEMFYWVEAEDCHVGDASNSSPLIFASQRVRRIFNHHEPMLVSEFENWTQPLKGCPA